MQTFNELIANACSALDAIAGHPDFVALLETELWDDPAISLADARQAIDNLLKAHREINQERQRSVVKS